MSLLLNLLLDSHFGLCPQADLTPFTLASPLEAHPRSAGGVPTNTNVPNNGMHNYAFPEGRLVSPGQVGEVQQRLCGCKCELCDTPCVLQRRGHTIHRCMLHKIP